MYVVLVFYFVGQSGNMFRPLFRPSSGPTLFSYVFVYGIQYVFCVAPSVFDGISALFDCHFKAPEVTPTQRG